MNVFGMEFKSREEREREEQEYLYRIFPGGNEQKDRVEKELTSRLPGLDGKGLMLYYILLRDAMTGRDGMCFEDAAARISKKQRILKATPEMLSVVRAVMDPLLHAG